MSAFERELVTAVEREDHNAVVAALAKRGTGAFAVGADPGTAKGADIMLAARLSRSHFKHRPAGMFGWVKRLLAQPDHNGHLLW